MRLTASSGDAASRLRRANPCTCSQRLPSKSRPRRRTSLRSTQPGERPALGRQRCDANGRRTAHGIHGARRSLARGARRAAEADERRVRGALPDVLARRRLGRVRERAHGPVRAVAVFAARRRLVQLTFGALEPRHPAVRPDGNLVAYAERESLGPEAPRGREDTRLAAPRGDARWQRTSSA